MRRHSDIDLTLAVLCVIWPKNTPISLLDLADICGVHRNSIWQIEERAKRKLKQAMMPRINELLPE